MASGTAHSTGRSVRPSGTTGAAGGNAAASAGGGAAAGTAASTAAPSATAPTSANPSAARTTDGTDTCAVHPDSRSANRGSAAQKSAPNTRSSTTPTPN